MDSLHGLAPKRVAVIGGGLCGAFFAAQLARVSTVPVAISVIEPRERLGGGVAYSSIDPAHRINVPAARMTLFPENPTDFDTWFRQGPEIAHDPGAVWGDGNAYPRRAAFGRYVAEIVASQADNATGSTIDHIRATAQAVVKSGAGYTIDLSDGGQITAEIVVLATSHPPPGLPALIARELGRDPAVIANPWKPGALADIAPDEDVLIIGTGLTSADVVASLSLSGHRGHITAFSRRGLLPRGHARTPVPVVSTWFTDREPPSSVLSLTRLIRARIEVEAANGLPWQALFDDVRANGQRFWRQFAPAEKRRFLRHLRVFWDAHRYRIAPQIEQVLHDKQQDGTLKVMAASLISAKREQDKINISVHPRRRPRGETVTMSVDRVIITTGPSHGTVVAQNPALLSLANQGLLQADDLGLGVKVDPFGQVVDVNGESGPTLLVVGPLARGQYGELMGLPQVAAQPDAVAKFVAAAMVTGKARK
jgi:uncharacterized NAD(P)/FAD-binding protein YdhS